MERFLGAITTGCMRPFVPRTNKNELTTTTTSKCVALVAAECYLSSSTLFLPSNSFLPILLFLILFILLPTSECRRRGATGRLRRRLGSGGGHHARDRAGSRRLPPQRPARALPRPGPHAPLPQCATHWTRNAGVTGMSEGVGGDRVGRARGARGRKRFGGGGVHRRFIPDGP